MRRCSEVRDVRFAAGMKVNRPSERIVERALVAKAWQTAVSVELPVMRGDHLGSREPPDRSCIGAKQSTLHQDMSKSYGKSPPANRWEATMSQGSQVATGLRRGFALRCPQCGEGDLFGRFLKVRDCCEICRADNTLYPSDDAPPYVTLILVGHLFAPLIFWLDDVWKPSVWVTLGLSLPAIAAVTLALLPHIKGAVVGFAWATGVTRDTAQQ